MIQINKKKGFTLVELLAVIVILAIILVIAVPKVMSIIEDAKMGTLESTAKMIASQAEKQKVQNTVLGNDKAITCEGITNINKEDYPSCEITFEDNTAKVTITGGGKFEGLYVCNGTKTSATATKEECGGTQKPAVLNCTFDGELVQGVEFTHNQYTYRYMQEYGMDDEFYLVWKDIEQDGWGVKLTDEESIDPINTQVCLYINEKPIVSMSYMFSGSAATSIDLSSFDTSNVTNMSYMFQGTAATSLDLSSFDTSNVTNMSHMFRGSAATSLDLSNFDTSNVTKMASMFNGSKATSLDLSSFDTSNVTTMDSMFKGSVATILDLSSFDTNNNGSIMLMFGDINATTIYVGDNWNTTVYSDGVNVFNGATNLVGGNGTTYNENYTKGTYARVDKEGEPGYFTYKASN